MEHNHFAPAEERRPELYRRMRSTTKKKSKNVKLILISPRIIYMHGSMV